MRWRRVVGTGLLLMIGTGVWITTTLAKDKPVESSIDERHLEEQLDQILKTQEEIFAKLDLVMEELGIAKIRATLRKKRK